MSEEWAAIVREKNQEIAELSKLALDLSNHVVALREEVARLRAQAIDLQAELVLAQQQVGHLRQQPIALLRAAEEFVQYFDSNFVNPGLELCGLVNGQQIAPSGVQLNDLLACLRAALTQGKGGVNG